jgi:hypothetical protein
MIMVIDLNWARVMFKKKKNARRLETFKREREMIRQASEMSAPAVEIITAEEIAEVMLPISESGFEYRIHLDGADFHYNIINERNYKALADKMGHMERESEFVAAMCLVDKCEEYGDYDTMASTFGILEYVIRHNKTNTPVVTYAREYIIEMRKYLTHLNIL